MLTEVGNDVDCKTPDDGFASHPLQARSEEAVSAWAETHESVSGTVETVSGRNVRVAGDGLDFRDSVGDFISSPLPALAPPRVSCFVCSANAHKELLMVPFPVTEALLAAQCMKA